MIYTPMTMKALSIAYAAHHGQLDQAGLPYIHHPLHLAEAMADELTCTGKGGMNHRAGTANTDRFCLLYSAAKKNENMNQPQVDQRKTGHSQIADALLFCIVFSSSVLS